MGEHCDVLQRETKYLTVLVPSLICAPFCPSVYFSDMYTGSLEFCGPPVETKNTSSAQCQWYRFSHPKHLISLFLYFSLFQISHGENKLVQFRPINCAWERGKEDHIIGTWQFLLEPCRWNVGKGTLENVTQ